MGVDVVADACLSAGGESFVAQVHLVVDVPLHVGGDLIPHFLHALGVLIIGIERAQQGEAVLLIVYAGLFVVGGMSAPGDACTEVSAEAVAFAVHGADADNGFHGGFVFGTGVGDELYFVDVGGGEAVQFGEVLQQAVVDVDDGGAFAEYGVAFFGEVQAGNVPEYVVGVVERGEQGVLDAGFQFSGFQLIDGARGGDYGFG